MDPVVTYDTDGDVYVVTIRPGEVARTVKYDEVHLVDLDAHGNVLEIEVLDPRRARITAVAEAFGLTQLVPAMRAAIVAQVPTTLVTGATSIPIPVSAGFSSVGEGHGRSVAKNPATSQEIDLVS